MKFIKEAYRYYKELKLKERAKQQLLNTELNYVLLQELLNKCANNPGLVIEINLKTGDKLLLKTKAEERTKTVFDYIDGREVIE